MSENDLFADLAARHAALVAAEPRLRMRERAARLGASEAELVAANCGAESIQLQGPPAAIFRELGTLGEVMALTRNDWCVHERHGRYEDIQATGGPVGIVLGPDIDLRMFFGCWRFTYAVTENGRRSLQFFDAEGVAVHKVYATDATDMAAWQALVDRFATGKTVPRTEAIAPADERAEADDPAALRAHWRGLADTHEFFPMLRKFKLARLGALRAAGTDLAQEVGTGSIEFVLQSAAASGLSIMCFVANRGMVQIHTGPVHALVRTGPWYNVFDPKFNLHLQTEAITSCWIVNKPTADGWVTSLEAYAQGELVVQFFGERKPGKPELAAWRELLLGMCTEPLAA